MIFVFRDPTKIPQAWLDKVSALQTQLEQLAYSEERKAFIDRHSDIWGEIKDQLPSEQYNWKL